MAATVHDALDLLLEECPWLQPSLGLWIRPGWRPIVASALREIATTANQSDVDVQVEQVKEKFGRLKIYVIPPSVRLLMKDVLLRAEEQADATCDLCGAPGRLHGPGWLRVRCDAHVDTWVMPET